MQIKFTSILVDDQSKALAFYTEVLGFRKLSDIPMGEYRWLTVVSPDGVAGAEVVLEPMAFPPARTWQMKHVLVRFCRGLRDMRIAAPSRRARSTRSWPSTNRGAHAATSKRACRKRWPDC